MLLSVLLPFCRVLAGGWWLVVVVDGVGDGALHWVVEDLFYRGFVRVYLIPLSDSALVQLVRSVCRYRYIALQNMTFF